MTPTPPKQKTILETFSKNSVENMREIIKVFSPRVPRTPTGNLDFSKDLIPVTGISPRPSFVDPYFQITLKDAVDGESFKLNISKGNCVVNNTFLEILEESVLDIRSSAGNYIFGNGPTSPGVHSIYVVVYYNPTKFDRDAKIGLIRTHDYTPNRRDQICILGVISYTIVGSGGTVTEQKITQDDISVSDSLGIAEVTRQYVFNFDVIDGGFVNDFVTTVVSSWDFGILDPEDRQWEIYGKDVEQVQDGIEFEITNSTLINPSGGHSGPVLRLRNYSVPAHSMTKVKIKAKMSDNTPFDRVRFFWANEQDLISAGSGWPFSEGRVVTLQRISQSDHTEWEAVVASHQNWSGIMRGFFFEFRINGQYITSENTVNTRTIVNKINFLKIG